MSAFFFLYPELFSGIDSKRSLVHRAQQAKKKRESERAYFGGSSFVASPNVMRSG
jgi:hypothetical protein